MRLLVVASLLLPAIASAQPGAEPAVPVSPSAAPTSAEVLGLARGAHIAGLRGDCVGARTLAARIQRLDPDFYGAVISTDLSITACKPKPRVYAVAPRAAVGTWVTGSAAPIPVDDGANIGGQFLLGSLTGIGTGIVLAFLGAALISDEDMPIGAIMGGTVGLVAGSTAGVVIAGDNEGSDYSLALTLCGSIAGMTIGFKALESVDSSDGAIVAVLIGAPTLGAMLDFNMSRTTLRPTAPSAEPRTVPAAPRISDRTATVSLFSTDF